MKRWFQLQKTDIDQEHDNKVQEENYSHNVNETGKHKQMAKTTLKQEARKRKKKSMRYFVLVKYE
jgi:hypothetical protein